MRHLTSLLATAALASAHGFVANASIGGETYEFYDPNTDPYTNPPPERISRRIPGNGPVEDVSSIDVQCNGYTAGGEGGSEPAPLHAVAEAGSKVTLWWTLWPESHMGPVLTYMTRCPDTGCQEYEPTDDKVWFKVQEAGRDGTSDDWASVCIPVSHSSLVISSRMLISITGRHTESGKPRGRVYHPRVHRGGILSRPPRGYCPARRLGVSRCTVLSWVSPA